MKYLPSTFTVLWLMVTASGTLPVQAQSQSATPAAIVAARRAIQATTFDLDAALMRGDAPGALAFLAPDFELGHHQYRKRDAAWMRLALPRQLELAQFTELAVTITGVELHGEQAVAHEKINVTAALKAGGRSPGISGSVVALWVNTPRGWRLKGTDGTFDVLQVLVPTEPPGLSHAFAAPENNPAAPRDNPSLVLAQAHRGGVDLLSFSPDGTVLATYDVYDGLGFAATRTGTFLNTMATPMAINSMTYAPDGTLVTGHNDGMVRVWDEPGGKLRHTLSVSRWSVYAVRVSPDSHTLAVDGAVNVQLWDMATGHKLRTFGKTGGNVRALDFSPDGSTLAFTSTAGVELWNTHAGTLIQVVKDEQRGGFLPDGKTMVTVTSGRVRFRAVGSETIEREVAIPNPLYKPSPTSGRLPSSEMIFEPSAVIAPNGRLAASIYADGSIGLWDTRTGTVQHILRGFQSDVMGGDVSTLAFAPDSAALAVGSRSGETAIWLVK